MSAAPTIRAPSRAPAGPARRNGRVKRREPPLTVTNCAGYAEVQRARILNAAAELIARDAGHVSTIAIVANARVSRSTFCQLFGGRQPCLEALAEEYLARLTATVAPSYEQTGAWPERLRVALTAALQILEAQPALGRLAVGHLLGLGPAGGTPPAHLRQALAKLVDGGRAESEVPPPPLVAEVMLAGGLAAIYRRLEDGAEPLLDFVNGLLFVIVLPYRGQQLATQELTHQREPLPLDTGEFMPTAAAAAPIRMTRRSTKTLQVIAQTPGLSNANVGRRAGIIDQGQTSRLLARLADRGLIENTSPASTGAPNAWGLTSAGRDLLAVWSKTTGYLRAAQ